MKKLKWAPVALLLILLLAALGIVAFTQIATAVPDEVALEGLHSTNEVRVEDGEWLVFRPSEGASPEAPSTGLIFYPGGLVNPKAYAPLARDIAAEGYLVVIPPMPLNLAVLDVGEAQKVIDAFPEIQNWAIGGHSLGGVMASQFIKDYPWAADGLVLLGAYPTAGTDISCRVLKAVSIFGTNDGLSSPEEIETARELLPPDTNYVAIEGGNHAQFGWYGPQRGDLPAEISHQEQQTQAVAATVQLLATLNE